MNNYLFLLAMTCAWGSWSSAIYFEPGNLLITPPEAAWEEKSGAFKDEKYQAVRHNRQEVFFVLPRFVPYVTCIIEQAKQQKARVSLLDPAVIFFNNADLLKKYLVVKADPANKVMVLIPQEIVCFSETEPFGGKKYYFKTQKMLREKIELNKHEYQGLLLMKESAATQKHWLQITCQADTNQITYDFATTPQQSNQPTCTVCLEKN